MILDMNSNLEIKDLHVVFNTDYGKITAVENLSFTLKPETIGIVGESGSGKSVTNQQLCSYFQNI